MRERPIPFSAPMVVALLAGTKTQTRRAMKYQPGEDTTVHVEAFNQTVIDRHGEEQPGPEIYGAWWDDGESGLRCPYGAPGDQLWVREAWRTVVEADALPPRELTPAHRLWYEADCRWPDAPHQPGFGRYRPAMFMPRWASRTQLGVSQVRVERLQAISEADAIAEGIEAMRCSDCHLAAYGLPGWGHDELNPTPQGAYRFLWESINGAGSWDANPYVWAVSFRRLKP